MSQWQVNNHQEVCSSWQHPVPTSVTAPTTSLAAGEARLSQPPVRAASVRNLAAVSKLIFSRGLVVLSMPRRLQALQNRQCRAQLLLRFQGVEHI